MLTKTDFIQYLHCPESLWLKKNKPEEYPEGEVSLFLEKLIQEGYEVEEYAKKLFSGGVEIPTNASPEMTQAIMNSGGIVYFQPSFVTAKGAFARVDILERLADGTLCIYEVKSSTSVKTEPLRNHIKDTAFQKYVLTQCGLDISTVKIIHLNKDYVKNGDINPNKLLEVVDVTQEVNAIGGQTQLEIQNAMTFLRQPSISPGCSCVEKTRRNHCDAVNILNPDIPEYSIYELNRISAKKIGELRELGVTDIGDIPESYDLNTKHELHKASLLREEPIYDKTTAQRELDKLTYPLHFIDYETYPSAIPKVDGIGPHEHLTFQVSIHILKKDGSQSHYEYLSETMELPKKLVEFMEKTTGQNGTFISWHAQFERSRNEDMKRFFPEHEDYLDYMNCNMFDLEELFKEAYMDYRFRGKTSIKYILPVMIPDLSYEDLNIKDGTSALDTWGRWVQSESLSEQEWQQTKQDLLDYCKLDTLAMVRIYEKLKELTNS